MPTPSRSVIAVLVFAANAAACADGPSAPVSNPASDFRAAAVTTDPPPPPIAGRGMEGGGADTKQSCADGWAVYSAAGLTYEYLRSPRENMAKLTIHGDPVVGRTAHIITTGSSTRGRGELHFGLTTFEGPVSVTVDLATDIRGGVLQQPGVDEFLVPLWGQLTEPDGQTCRAPGVLGVMLESHPEW